MAPSGPCILMLRPSINTRGPVPGIAQLLAEGFEVAGLGVRLVDWGGQSEGETLAGRVLSRAKSILAVRGALQSQEFSVLLVHTSHDMRATIRDVLLLAATEHLRPATVIHFHGSSPERLLGWRHAPFKMVTRLLVRYADAIIVLSSQEQVVWEQSFPFVRFYTVSNPFGTFGRSRPSSAGDGRARSAGVPVLLFVGRLIQEKGVIDLLEAIARVKKAGIDCRLLLAGDGPLRSRVRAEAEGLNLTNDVTRLGHLGKEELADLYQSADVFVLPTYHAEGFPTVIAEAMTSGLPIVTTRIRGAADHLADGVNALFVPPRDPRALASALMKILDNPVLRAEMGRANMEKVKDFDPQVVATHYLRIIKEVAAAGA